MVDLQGIFWLDKPSILIKAIVEICLPRLKEEALTSCWKSVLPLSSLSQHCMKSMTNTSWTKMFDRLAGA